MSPYDESWNLDAQPPVRFHAPMVEPDLWLALRLRAAIATARNGVARAEKTLRVRRRQLKVLEASLARVVSGKPVHKH